MCLGRLCLDAGYSIDLQGFRDEQLAFFVVSFLLIMQQMGYLSVFSMI